MKKFWRGVVAMVAQHRKCAIATKNGQNGKFHVLCILQEKIQMKPLE